MKIIPPIEVETFSDVIKNNEQGNFGFYPLSKNNYWHGGIHLYSSKPIRAVADGQLIAYRLSKEYVKTKCNDKEIELSDSFILLKHTHETPNQQKIEFYSLYMHLRPWNVYKETDKYPEFTYKPSYFINVKEDGTGLRIRGEEDRTAIVAVMPKEALFKKLSDDPPPWKVIDKKGKLKDYSEYKKVEYQGKVGYSFLTKDTYSVIIGSACKLTKYVADEPVEGTKGLAVRQYNGADSPVLEILPYGTQVYFEKEDEFVGKKNENGYYKLDPAKHGENCGWIFCKRDKTKGERIRIERKPEQPVLDELVKLSTPIDINAGDILGYAGKWYGDDVFHFELFTHSIDFMKNLKRDKASKPVYCIKKDASFKDIEYPEKESGVTIPSDFILVLLSKESEVGKPPLIDARQVALQPVCNVWVKREILGEYDAKDSCYTVIKDITAGYTIVSEDGKADEKSVVQVTARKGEFVRFLDQKQGNYRLIRVKLNEGEKKVYWIKRLELQATFKKPEYWTTSKISNVWKSNPELLSFTKEHEHKLSVDTEFNGSEVEKLQVNGNTWYGFNLSGSEKKGWICEGDKNLKISDPYNWEAFFDIVKDLAPNGYCDCKDLIKKIESVTGNKQDEKLTTAEIKNAINDPSMARQLRRLVIHDKTEWSAVTDESISKWGKFYKNNHPGVVKKGLVDIFKKFQWWDDVAPVLDPLLKPQSLWFFHPVVFLEHLGKLESRLDLLLEKPRLSGAEIKLAREDIIQLTEKDRCRYYIKLQEKVKYKNQRNNNQSHYVADRMCNLTSVAMALEYLGVENPEPDKQFEDYLEKKRSEEGYGARTSDESWSKLASLFGITMKNISLYTNDKAVIESKLKPELEMGHGVVISVFSVASGKGHIVRLQNITTDGLVVDDPFGKINNFKEREDGGSGYTGTSNTREFEVGLGEDNVWKWTEISETTLKYADVFLKKD
jgi:hypothetical protein